MQHHAQDAIDAKPRVPEPGVGVGHFAFSPRGSTVSGRHKAALGGYCAAGQHYHVLDLLGLEEREHRGRREAPIEAHPDRGRAKGRAQPPNQAPQEPPGPAAGRRIAGPQHGGDGILLRLVAESHRGDDRQIAPGVVVAIEEGQLLLVVGRVVGRIEIDRDAGGPALEPAAMVLDDGIGQHLPHREPLAPPHGILESRQRGLRGQGWPHDRIAVDQQFVVPDNVLFEGGAGARRFAGNCFRSARSILSCGSPTGIFYAQRVKANVLFFDRKPASETPWTKTLWVYDFRTNKHLTLRQNTLTRPD